MRALGQMAGWYETVTTQGNGRYRPPQPRAGVSGRGGGRVRGNVRERGGDARERLCWDVRRCACQGVASCDGSACCRELCRLFAGRI